MTELFIIQNVTPPELEPALKKFSNHKPEEAFDFITHAAVIKKTSGDPIPAEYFELIQLMAQTIAIQRGQKPPRPLNVYNSFVLEIERRISHNQASLNKHHHLPETQSQRPSLLQIVPPSHTNRPRFLPGNQQDLFTTSHSSHSDSLKETP